MSNEHNSIIKAIEHIGRAAQCGAIDPTSGDLGALIERIANATDYDAVRAEVPDLLHALAALPVLRKEVLGIALVAAFGAGRFAR